MARTTTQSSSRWSVPCTAQNGAVRVPAGATRRAGTVSAPATPTMAYAAHVATTSVRTHAPRAPAATGIAAARRGAGAARPADA